MMKPLQVPRNASSSDAMHFSTTIARLILDPFMIHELFPSLTETALGSHPRCVVSVTYDFFHGGNTGSNPVGDASLEPTTSSDSPKNS
jgi:hypothetical protein